MKELGKSQGPTTLKVGIVDVPGDVSDAELLEIVRGADSQLAAVAKRIYQQRHPGALLTAAGDA